MVRLAADPGPERRDRGAARVPHDHVVQPRPPGDRRPRATGTSARSGAGRVALPRVGRSDSRAGLVVGGTMNARRTLDPLAWMGFGAGGMVAALVLPACMAVLAVLVPLGVVDLPAREDLLS